MSNQTVLRKILANEGIARVDDIYDTSELAAINAVLDPHFESRASEPRAYAYPGDLQHLQLIERLLSPAMLALLHASMDNPRLYHFHVYEIAAQQSEPHIFADRYGGWHRDGDCEYRLDRPTHVSVFVYLRDVFEDDGPFEFLPKRPMLGLGTHPRYVSATGAAGTSFIWNRAWYHRASANRGARRRRVLKLSVQEAAFRNNKLDSELFDPMREDACSYHPGTRILLGLDTAAPLDLPPVTAPQPMTSNAISQLTAMEAMQTALSDMARSINRTLRR